jgi:hypothetical protein
VVGVSAAGLPNRVRVAAVALLLLALLLLAVPDGGRAGAGEAPGGEPRLRLVEQTAWVEPDGDFGLRVRAEGAPEGARLEMAVHERLTAHDQFLAGLEDGSLGGVLTRRCGAVLEDRFATIDPCQVDLAEAETSAGGAVQLGLGFRSSAGPADRVFVAPEADGVYPVEVRLVGPDDEELARLVTHLVRLPPEDDDSPPLRVGVVVPLSAPLARQPDGSTQMDPDALSVLTTYADALARYPDVPVTVIPRPETIDALAAGARGPELIEELVPVLPRSQVLEETYVDVDLTAWAAADLGDELDEQLAVGRQRVAQQLDAPVDGGTWLIEPTATADTLAARARDGVDQLVVPSELLRPLDEARWPLAFDRPFQVDGGDGGAFRAVMDDESLRAHIGATGDPVLDAHRLLADLALLYSQQPGIPRGVSFSLPATGTDAEFLDTLLAGLAAGGVLEAATIDRVLARAEVGYEGGFDVREGEPLVRELIIEPAPDVSGYRADLQATESRLEPYRQLAGPDDALPEVEELLRVSGAAELDETARRAYLDAAVARVASLADSIEAPEQSRVTLTAREGRIPIELVNHLDHPVEVLVRLDSDKLEFPEGAEQRTELEPGDNRLVWLVRSRASGAFPVDVSVHSPDGRLRLDDTRFTMRSTAVPGIGIALSALAALFLAVWWARHWNTTRRARRLMPAPSEGQQPGIDQLSEV